MSLLVPIPHLRQDGNPSPLVSEKPITLSCGPVTFSDGTPLTVFHQPKSTFRIYRQLFGGAQQVLDSATKSWVAPSPSVADLKLFWNNSAMTWQAVIVAMGNKDSAGNDLFESNPWTGFPRYAAECLFTGIDPGGAQQTGQSALSPAFQVLAAGQNNLAGLSMDPQDPTAARQIKIFLRNSALAEQGHVTIWHDIAGFHVQLLAGGSSVVLSDSGDIILSSANGRPVQINGDLTVSGGLTVGGIPVQVP